MAPHVLQLRATDVSKCMRWEYNIYVVYAQRVFESMYLCVHDRGGHNSIHTRTCDAFIGYESINMLLPLHS